ncbi:hypothetical protein BDV23DRAFT_176260 [Aspergillus alliaceus]|uniref:Altered inheritance of mitochondria protein 9, mitochondrial n=1 Tax=Petromyces alliaceus TaxID=209559 RepID=A0A5N7BUE8_PETAA|nr:hypothetical protein BDV23DRAFT_176260 [Aspergillus alliaceus]
MVCRAELSVLSTMDHTNSPFFHYTSGRWVYNEQSQLEKHYVEFGVLALQRSASRIIHEGLYNKAFSLKMEYGREVLARIPNPNAGHPQYVAASEVATLGFLSSQGNAVGSEYILIERVNGRQPSEVWDAMSEAQPFGLVKSLVAIEKKLANVKFSFHGSLYYKDTYLHGKNQKQEVNIHPGPWQTAQEYISSIANREFAVIRNLDTFTLLGKTTLGRDMHVHLLEQFLPVLAHILPPKEALRPVLLHYGLHSDNIFVGSSDPSKISGIIEWQATKLPEGSNTPSQPENESAKDKLSRLRLKKFYELASRKFNQPLIKAVDAMRNNGDQVMARIGVALPCPISFTQEVIEKRKEQIEAWAGAYGEFDRLRASIVGNDGWVSTDEYTEAMGRWRKIELP